MEITNDKRVQFGVVTVIIIAIITAIFSSTSSDGPILPVNNDPQPIPFDAEGTLTCAPPRKSDGPVTLICAYSIELQSGDHYLLQFPEDVDWEHVLTGETYNVKGMLDKTSANETEYDIRGTITVESID